MTNDFKFNPGVASKSFSFLNQRIPEERIVERITADDPDLWPEMGDLEAVSGWRDAPQRISGALSDFICFAREVKDLGMNRAVLLGMGGSVQGARVLTKLLGSPAGIPVTVVDTIVPERLRAVTESNDPEETLFIVASKSGTTVETMSLYRYFRRVVGKAVGPSTGLKTGDAKAGRHFVAVTDPGSPLALLSERDRFLRRFEGPPEVVGRFSVLTQFGLVPAGLGGVDVRAIVQRAVEMSRACENRRSENNPGAGLGAYLASLMLDGRDKLTVLASPGVRALIPWIEHLIAESTGKGGTGLIPVVNEPPLSMEHYGEDRAFVHIGFEREDDGATRALLRSLKKVGHPVAAVRIGDRLDLGAEMYRWQFATVVASALAGPWPFDQPDVQASKDMARGIVNRFLHPPAPDADDGSAIADALQAAPPGSYLSVMAFMPNSRELDAALQELRQTVVETWGYPVTVGYGPAFLHSTGQLHKGGPRSVIGLQLLSKGGPDVHVTSENHSFGDLLAAQADADLETLRGKEIPAFRLMCGTDPAGALLALCGEIRKIQPV